MEEAVVLAGGYRLSDVTDAYMERNDSPSESHSLHSLRVGHVEDVHFGFTGHILQGI
jgi:hypothetical protein